MHCLGQLVNTNMTGYLRHASQVYNRKIIMDSKSSSGFDPNHFEGALTHTQVWVHLPHTTGSSFLSLWGSLRLINPKLSNFVATMVTLFFSIPTLCVEESSQVMVITKGEAKVVGYNIPRPLSTPVYSQCYHCPLFATLVS